MEKWLTVEEAMEILSSNFREIGCQIESDDYGQKLKLKIGNLNVMVLDRKLFAKLSQLEKTISKLKGELNEN